MKLGKRIVFGLVAIALSLALNGCIYRCSDRCNEHGGCYENYCECNPGYMGEECELLAAAQLADTFDVVALSANVDSVIHLCILSGDPYDVAKLYITDLHGTGPVTALFSYLTAEVGALNFGLPSQSIGTIGTVSGNGYYVDRTDQVVLYYTITDSLGSRQWEATFTRR
jgi:hypothetical protein